MAGDSIDLDISWSDTELELEEFLDTFKLPQVVQVAEGTYGKDDETTLSRGEILNLHLVKDVQYFEALTLDGSEVRFPLNCPRKVQKFLVYETVEELCAEHPWKFEYVIVTRGYEASGNPARSIHFGQRLKLLFVDVYGQSQRLICLDNDGCELSLPMDVRGDFQVLEDSKEYFLAELSQHFSLPFYVRFVQSPNPSSKRSKNGDQKYPNGLIQLDKIKLRQMIIATTLYSKQKKCVLTFPRDLPISVVVAREARSSSLDYVRFCERLNSEINFESVERRIDAGEEIYDDVCMPMIKIIPYAETFIGNLKKDENLNDCRPSGENDVDDPTYFDMDNLSNSSDGYEEIDESSFPWPIPSTHDCVSAGPSTNQKSSTRSEKGQKRKTGLLGRMRKITLKRKKSPGHSSSTSPVGSDFTKFRTSRISTKGDAIYEAPNALKTTGRELGARYSLTRMDAIGSDRNIENLTVKEIGLLLHDLNLGEYADRFEKEDVDGKMLKELSKDVLQTHFNMSYYHALKLSKAATENWRPKKQ